LQAAYDLPSSSAGSGETVAIVDAYSDPHAQSDLSTYRSEFGLKPICSKGVTSGCITFTEVNQTGGTSLPRANVAWSEEISVDLDMVSAICPLCDILLVEAGSASFANLGAAEGTAASAKPAPVSIGNSYGGSEGNGETAYDAYYDHPGIAITVASGDDGYGVEYPAASRYVTAVGGTTLNTATNARGYAETAWSDAGSGCSAYEAQPTWQDISSITTNCAHRAVADVSAVANPSTGVAVYDSYGLSGWTVFGGTSVAAQIISGTYALAAGTTSSPSPSSAAVPAALAYAHPGSLNYVSSGSNGNCGNDLCNAADGTAWNGPTGLGTPDGTGAF
jgi:subtilase family serine protease